MRRKPWARPELAACPFFVDEPQELRGRWGEAFPASRPMVLELGCGKGRFIARMGREHPDWNFVGVDLKSEVLVLAKRAAEEEYTKAGRPVDNLFLLSQDIERLPMIFAPGEDVFRRIHINFCNPWPKPRHHKHRLTHTRQLLDYRALLEEGGEVYFKTDDDQLFGDTLDYLKEAGYGVKFLTRDLHAAGFSQNVVTEHEKMFMREGIPIKFLIAAPDAPEKGARQYNSMTKGEKRWNVNTLGSLP